MIYFDNNATTKIEPEVLQEMMRINCAFNPSSAHYAGREAKALIEKTRKALLSFLKIDSSSHGVIFTASGTEANNLILNNYKNHKIFISATEHASLYHWKKYYPNNIFLVNVDEEGVIDLDHLRYLLDSHSDDKILISVMAANNETGVVQPLDKIIAIAKKYKSIYLHSDAVQVIGKEEFSANGLDFITISAHKFGGPVGCGALVYNKSLHLEPQIIGGGQEFGFRSGTENVMAIVGMAKAIELLPTRLIKKPEILKMRNYLEDTMLNIAPNRVIVFAKNSKRIANTSFFATIGLDYNIQLMKFDLSGIAVSTGSACSSGKISASHVLKAMLISEEITKSAIRVSLSHLNNYEEIDKFVNVWKSMLN